MVGCANVVVIWGNTPDCGSVGDHQRPSVPEHSGALVGCSRCSVLQDSLHAASDECDNPEFRSKF